MRVVVGSFLVAWLLLPLCLAAPAIADGLDDDEDLRFGRTPDDLLVDPGRRPGPHPIDGRRLDEMYVPEPLEPAAGASAELTVAVIEERVEAAAARFPLAGAAFSVVDRAIPDFLTSARLRKLFLTAALPMKRPKGSPVTAHEIEKARQDLDDLGWLDALKAKKVRRAILYLDTAGIFPDETGSHDRNPHAHEAPPRPSLPGN